MEIKDFASIGSVLFAIYRYFYPKNLSKYDLCFIKGKEIEFNSHNFELFPELKFEYNNKSIKDIKLIQFSIRNTGTVDITNEMLKDKISVQFPADYKILNSKLNDKQNLTKSKIIIKSNNLFINWVLLKPKEQIIINTLLEINNPIPINEILDKNSFYEEIIINHRIQGVDSIGKFLSKEHETQENTKSTYLIQGYVNLFVGILFLIQIPFVFDWIFNILNDYQLKDYEWNIWEITSNIVFFLLSAFHLLASIFSFYLAKQYK